MNRRDMLRDLGLLGLAAGMGPLLLPAQAGPDPDRLLFPSGLPTRQWREFRAADLSSACGVIYDQRRPPRQGMALGAIDTGYFSLEPDGTIGYCTIFNSIAPQRGPLHLPLLGLSAGKQVWLLANPQSNFGEYMFTGVQTPANIRYWGHFPVVDLEFEMPGSPVSAGLRAWAPFLPGDATASNCPGVCFDLHVRNLTSERQSGRVALTLPGPTQAEAQIARHSPRQERFDPYVEWIATAPAKTRAVRQQVRGEFAGLVVNSEKVPEIGYAIGIIDGQAVETGGALAGESMPYSSGNAWANFASHLPAPRADDFGGSVSAAYELGPGEEKTLRFVMTWFAPMWIGQGQHTFRHMYSSRYDGALAVAQSLSRNRDALYKRIMSWQQTIYAERQLPIWLRESLVNILYLFPVNSLWAMAEPPIGPWCRPEDGLFGMIDGIVEDPAVEPMPDTFYANAPIVYFFPDLALSTLRGYKAYQFTNGAAPWIFGGVVGEANGGYEATAGPEMASPTPGYQATTTGPCYVDMVDRYWRRSGDDAVLREFYSSVKLNTIYTMNLRQGDGDADIISVPTGDIDPYRPKAEPGYHLEWFESVLWYGMTAHIGGIHLANLEMAERMAEAIGDRVFAAQCRQWLEEGRRAMEGNLWNGRYYLAYNEPKSGKKSDDIFAYQLDGNWMAEFHGLSPVFPPAHAAITLTTIRKTCAAITPYGAVNMVKANGQLAMGVGYGPNVFFVPELYMLAMTYMYAGQKDFGLELARRCVKGIMEDGSEWNQPNILRADNGEPAFGSHYDQNMMLWALPAAIDRQEIKNATAPGSFVARILRAAKGG